MQNIVSLDDGMAPDQRQSITQRNCVIYTFSGYKYTLISEWTRLFGLLRILDNIGIIWALAIILFFTLSSRGRHVIFTDQWTDCKFNSLLGLTKIFRCDGGNRPKEHKLAKIGTSFSNVNAGKIQFVVWPSSTSGDDEKVDCRFPYHPIDLFVTSHFSNSTKLITHYDNCKGRYIVFV